MMTDIEREHIYGSDCGPYEMPNKTKNPFSIFFWELDIPILNQWNLVRFNTIGDGSCLIHACLNAFFIPYWTEKIADKKVSRSAIVKDFRNSLSKILERDYDILQGGNIKEFSKNVDEFKIDNMKKILSSDSPMGYGYIELISRAIDKDIYIIDFNNKWIYISDEMKFYAKGDRNSIIICYIEQDCHFELVGNQVDEYTFQTLFSPKHPLICRIRTIVAGLAAGTVSII